MTFTRPRHCLYYLILSDYRRNGEIVKAVVLNYHQCVLHTLVAIINPSFSAVVSQ